MGFMEKFKIKNKLVRECLGELLGTFVLVAFGEACVAQYKLGPLTGNTSMGAWHSVAAGWGLAVAMGAWVAGGVSGGHINPAVTTAVAFVGKFPKSKVIPYMCAQYIGAFLAAACNYGVYHDAAVEACKNTPGSDNAKNITGACAMGGVFASYPAGDWLTTGGAVSDQLFSTFLIMVCILAIVDEHNMKPPKGMIPLCVGLVFFVIGLTYGLNVGFPVNPARDFAPRLFTLIAGFGEETFTAYDYYFWVPWIIPHIGMFLGAVTYVCLIENHETDEDDLSVHQIELRTKPEVDGKVNGSFDVHI